MQLVGCVTNITDAYIKLLLIFPQKVTEPSLLPTQLCQAIHRHIYKTSLTLNSRYQRMKALQTSDKKSYKGR